MLKSEWTVKIQCPDKIVLMPDFNEGGSLVDLPI